MLRVVLSLVLGVAASTMAPGFAHAGSTPARLIEGEHSIESLLRLPEDLSQGRYVVFCEALIRRDGRAKTFTCYSAEKGLRDLVNAVDRAGTRARYVPAMRDGVPAAVYMVLMARIDITEQGPLVLVVPNNGADAARYGLLYTAPQRFNEFFLHTHGTSRTTVWQMLSIDEHGKVIAYDVMNAPGASAGYVRDIKAGMARMEFIPGFFEGKAVPMLYAEPLYDCD